MVSISNLKKGLKNLYKQSGETVKIGYVKL